MSSSSPSPNEQASRLEDVVRALDIPYGRERSFRVAPGSLSTNRFLLTVNRSAAEKKGKISLSECFERMGAPEAVLREVAWHLEDAPYVHFGFEGREGGGIFKIYLEFDPEGSGLAEGSGAVPAVLQHLAFKWRTSDPDGHVVTLYHWHPGLSADGIAQRIEGIYDGSESDESREIAKGILELAAARTGETNLRYLEVTEDDNPRRSFDVTTYDAGLRVGEIQSFLSRMCARFSIPTEEFDRLFASIESRRFGHLAGGVHRGGRDFFNVYYGAEGHGE